MKHPGGAQVAWQICKLLSELDVLLWNLYWDEFESLYEKEDAEKYWRETIHTDHNACQT
jgi:hypothetical protein